MGKIHMVLTRHMWVEIVVGSHPCYEKFFLGKPLYSSFTPSSKPNIL